jgi:putative transposase
MTTLFHKLLLTIASVGYPELVRQLHYMKVELEILRGKIPGRISVTPGERRRLVRAASRIGRAIHQLATIVTPGTVLRWIREERETGRKRSPIKRGRRRTPEQIHQLVLKLARENNWGYTRIIGELKKLGIRPPSKNTVKRILKENGFDPGPRRGNDSWDEFLKRHAHSLWQCDFLSRRVMTIKGLRDAFVMAFVHVKTRQVILSPATFHPNDQWVSELAGKFVEEARGRGLKVRIVQTDRDRKFAAGFVETLKRNRVKRRRISFKAPNLNAYAERFIQTIGQECLDKFLIFGLRHFDHLNSEFLAHYHEDRPHQSLGNEPVLKKRCLKVPEGDPVSPRDIRCRSRLGGLLRSYSRKAA